MLPPSLRARCSPLAAFALADERLRRPKSPGQFCLRQARTFAGFTQQSKENTVILRIDGLFHATLGRLGWHAKGQFRIVQNRLLQVVGWGGPPDWSVGRRMA